MWRTSRLTRDGTAEPASREVKFPGANGDREKSYPVDILLLFLTFSVLAANPRKLLYTVANPARDLLKREKNTKRKSLAAPPPHTALILLIVRVTEENKIK